MFRVIIWSSVNCFIVFFQYCITTDSTSFFWHHAAIHSSIPFITSFLAYLKSIFWGSQYLGKIFSGQYFLQFIILYNFEISCSNMKMILIFKWRIFTVEHGNGTENGSMKQFSISILDIIFLQLKIDDAIGCLKLYTAARFIGWS